MSRPMPYLRAVLFQREKHDLWFVEARLFQWLSASQCQELLLEWPNHSFRSAAEAKKAIDDWWRWWRDTW